MIEENEKHYDPETVLHEKLKTRVILEEPGYIITNINNKIAYYIHFKNFFFY